MLEIMNIDVLKHVEIESIIMIKETGFLFFYLKNSRRSQANKYINTVRKSLFLFFIVFYFSEKIIEKKDQNTNDVRDRLRISAYLTAILQ